MTRSSSVLALLVFSGCGGVGSWEVSTWGEGFIEDGIPAEEFEDGCSATFSQFTYMLAEASLLDGGGTAVTATLGARVLDVQATGPHDIITLEAPAQHFDEARFRIAPATSATVMNASQDVADQMMANGTSMHVVGQLTCGGVSKSFDWSFSPDSVYICEPESLTIGAGGTQATEFTIHGDHLFYDGLANEDALLRGTAIFDADTNEDGIITQAELAQVPVAPLGYQVGPNSEVTDLNAFIGHLTQTLGHVDGEGHCQVDL